MLEIKALATSPEFFEDVFNSIYSEWGKNNPEYWRSWIRSSMNTNCIPSTYVVLKDGVYIGTFSLWLCDLQSRQDLTPWVGGIVVDKNFRGQGVGLYIQEQAAILLKKLGIKQAYLFTELKGFYEKTGWRFIENAYDENNKIVRIYSKKVI